MSISKLNYNEKQCTESAQKCAPFLASLNLHVHTKNKYSLQTQIDS